MKQTQHRPLFSLCCLLAVLMLSACNSQYIEEPSSSGTVNFEIIHLHKGEHVAQADAPPPPQASTTPPMDSWKYVLGPSDVLDIVVLVPNADGSKMLQQVVPQNTQLQHTGYVLDHNGQINLPLVGTLTLGGKTVQEAQTHVKQSMQEYIINPQVELSIRTFGGKQAFVSGEVARPGKIEIKNQPVFVLDALQQTGSSLDTANLSHATLSRSDGTVECVNLQNLLFHGDNSQNKLLHNGDTLHIPRDHGNQFFILGEVRRPGANTLIGNMTLLDALGASQDVDRLTYKNNHIYVLRDTVFHGCEDVLAGKKLASKQDITTVFQLSVQDTQDLVLADQLELQPRDIVFVASRAVTEWSRFISQLVPNAVSTLGDRNRFETQ